MGEIIVCSGGDYLLATKTNQHSTCSDVERYHAYALANMVGLVHETFGNDDGHLEQRCHVRWLTAF